MAIVRNDTLSVPGANLYYEVRGSGPMLLMIHGAGGNLFFEVVDHLVDRFTVVTYDRRGYSRSQLFGPDEDYRVETHSDDVHRLLAELTDKPAYVFGSSAGAVIGLDFALRHPEQVRMFIPHEPPLVQLLSGEEQVEVQQIMVELQENHRKEGAIPAVMKFSSTSLGGGVALDGAGSAHHQIAAAQMELIHRNMEYFAAHEALGISSYTLVDGASLSNRLQSASTRVLPAGGRMSRPFLPYRSTVALAEQLGTTMVEFPGDHTGYTTFPREFADRLVDLFEK
ncbi:alpha/beta fold hydrolase [Alicyclobacillus fodiniaquatilis]|uniref:Alpha/beta fold hydrolase n=1 Tax=Alicyclobacillus fodiniaquatilis TaxID=1661150 RepID=A0ABW4JIK2_9BACL